MDIRRGSTLINSVRRGSTLVWSRSTVSGGLIPAGGLFRDDFNRDDADTLGTAWTSHGPSTDKFIGIENGFARLKLGIDQIGGFFDLRTSRMRYNAAKLSVDDGYIEVRMATAGSSQTLLSMSLTGYVAQAFNRLSDTAFTHGVGIHMVSGRCWIVSRFNNNETLRGDGGNFQAGDVLRLTSVGNLHTLTVNGAQRAQWNDGGGGAWKGTGYRSMGLRSDAGKDLLGPRRYSPAFDYVEVGSF